MTLSKHQQIFSINIAKLILKANELGIGLTFGEAHRTDDQQYLYYKGKKIKDGKLAEGIKRSWTMESNHLRRLGVDFNFFINGKLNYEYLKLHDLGKYWESLNENNQWGGFWKYKDTPHFEMNV
jgi:hypothetical protein